MKEGPLGCYEQDDCSACAADEAGERHWQRQPQIFEDVGAVSSDGSELPGPQGDGVGGVGLDGKHFHAEHGGEKQKRSAAGHGIEHSCQKGSHRQPDPMPIHVRRKARDEDH